jgi:pilus assembly protein Flp/PilA
MRRSLSRAAVQRFLSADEGATAIEYAVIASGVAGAIIVGINALGAKVAAMWASIAAAF